MPIYAILVICLPEFFQDPPKHFSQDIIEGMYSSEVAEWKSSRINQEIEINDLYRDIGWDKRFVHSLGIDEFVRTSSDSRIELTYFAVISIFHITTVSILFLLGVFVINMAWKSTSWAFRYVMGE